MPNSAESPVGVWPPPGSYPGDRGYGWMLLGVGWIIIGFTAETSLTILGISMFAIVGLLFLVTGVAYFWWSRSGRFQLWKRIITEHGERNGLRFVDLGSRDAVAAAVAVAVAPDTAVTVVVTSAKAKTLAERNMAAVGADNATVLTASLSPLPLDDNCADLVVSDSSVALVKKRSEAVANITEAVRIAAPGARIALVLRARSRGIRTALEAAGAEDVRISRVPLTSVTGYRLVEATIPT